LSYLGKVVARHHYFADFLFPSRRTVTKKGYEHMGADAPAAQKPLL